MRSVAVTSRSRNRRSIPMMASREGLAASRRSSSSAAS